MHIRVTPNASQSKIVGLHGHSLKISVKAPPIDGAANKELIRFLAKTLGISKNLLELTRGKTTKTKQVLIQNITNDKIRTILDSFL